MQNLFCKSLSNAVSFRVPSDKNILTFKPCCLYHKDIPFHPTYFKKTKIEFDKATDFLPDCKKCDLQERANGSSLRIVSNKVIPDNISNQIYKIELSIDTTCNAACIQCDATQSSLWRKEEAGLRKIIHIQPESQIDEKILQIKQSIDLDKVKIFHFWGGEPLLTDTHLKILKDIKDPSSVQLTYITNTSIFPKKEIFDLWDKFAKVRIGLSIDGINDRFHYIRYPLSWEKAKRNLNLFKTESPTNIDYHINYCATPLNVYYTDELETWLDKNFSEVNGKKVNLIYIRGEGQLDIAKTPDKLREVVYKKLSENHSVSNILKEVPVLDYMSMLGHLGKWDYHRNLNWRKTFHEISSFFE